MSSGAELERATKCIGEQLVKAARPRVWQPRWWNERLMAWVMGQPSLRLQAFRFIDVLPSLPTRDAVAEHLGEYLGEVRKPPWIARLIERVVVGGPRPFARGLAGLARWTSSRMARRFIAGADFDGVLATTARLRRRGWACSLDFLGEVVVGDAEADQHRAMYEAAITSLAPLMASWPEQARL
ncbi:MAG: L-glutamate gamma-semialdehyde dehydrogenase, partial [Planctomycetaceae bacterium]